MKTLPEPALQALIWAALGLEWSEEIVKAALQGVESSKGLDKRFQEYIWRLLSEEDNERKGLALIEAVLLLTNEDSPSRHNARARVDRPFLNDIWNTTESLGEQWQTRRFLDFWVDLREALSAPEREYQNGEILILDDHPGTDFDLTYREVARHLLGNPNAIKLVNLLNPADNGYDPALFRFFSGYQTLRSLETPDPTSLLLKEFEEGTQGVRFILVDQFFKLRGREEFFGDQVIRGLARWLHDSQDGAVGEPKEPPEIIALSRTDDPKVIQAALRAGAKDYVLKSRFVSLPAVLERVRRGTSDPSGSLHRTFRVLYDLPKETIGLLRSARIPRIPFHTGRHPEIGNESEETAALWSDLLARLPKTDLHVHAGSVMSREFLTLASLVMLARHPYEGGDKANPIMAEQLAQLVTFFHETLDRNDDSVRIEPRDAAFGESEPLALTDEGQRHICGKDWIQTWGLAAKRDLGRRLEKNDQEPTSAEYRSFRAHLHKGLAIRDYLSGAEAKKKLERKNNLDVAFYLLRHAAKISWPSAETILSLNLGCWKNDDLIRVYLLALASRYEDRAKIAVASNEDILQPLFGKEGNRAGAKGLWTVLREAFFGRSTFSIDAFRKRGWAWDHDWDREVRPPLVEVALPWPVQRPEDPRPPDFKKDPIGYTLASGTRSRNLAEYLLGCEFSGAEHLRHPFLMHVYARQVILDWVRQGVFYAELKASPDGFINPGIGFEYSSVVQCLVQAFSEAQQEVLEVYQQACAATPGEATRKADHAHWAASWLGDRYGFGRLRGVIVGEGEDMSAGEARQHEGCAVSWTPEERADAGLTAFPVRLPCKASLVFVGKRHKSLREMILEAAGAAVMRPAGEKPAGSAQEFVKREFATCRVVGFDLAGQEDGYPPAQYAEEFGRLSRLHVPITVHAGENAPPQFIEDAILKLGAVRIGHGLALAEDRRLLARVRDERIAIELCPVCNHQTSQFHDPAEERSRPLRPYPLADFVRAGLYVTINTDNPIISNTSMVREYFQASYAFDEIGSDGKPMGMALWEALRIIRMGFVCSFLNLPERSHMMEIVGQYLFDLFNHASVLDCLKKVAAPK